MQSEATDLVVTVDETLGVTGASMVLSVVQDRRVYVGGSDAPAIMGASEWSNALERYALKVAPEPPEDIDNEKMLWGRLQEPLVAAEYARRKGRVILPASFVRHPEHEWMAGTPDRYVDDPTLGRGILECKTTGQHMGHRWEEGPPLEPIIQLQHYLAVTGLKWGSIAVLIGGQKFASWDIERHDAFIEELIAAEAEFWERVQRRDPPEPDGSEASSSAIKALWPADNGASVILGPDANDITDELVTLEAEKDRLDLLIAERKNRIKMEIGEAKYGVLQDGRKWSYLTIEKAAHQVKASISRQLRPPKD